MHIPPGYLKRPFWKALSGGSASATPTPGCLFGSVLGQGSHSQRSCGCRAPAGEAGSAEREGFLSPGFSLCLGCWEDEEEKISLLNWLLITFSKALKKQGEWLLSLLSIQNNEFCSWPLQCFNSKLFWHFFCS